VTLGDRLAASGLALPPGHRLVSLEDDPSLRRAMGRLNGDAWPEFMLQDAVVDEHWHHLFDDWAATQACLFDAAGELVANLNSAPLAWDGTDDGLPDGWDDQLLRSVAGLAPGAPPADTLGAIQIVVRPDRQGTGLAGVMVGAMRAIAAARGYRALIACVRPTGREPYALVPIERYAHWTRADGLPVDPWIRLHVRLGGRVVRGVPASMTMRGTVAEWREWTGLELPESGEYLPRGAAAPVRIDLDADEGVYHDPNAWVVHRLR
jgi:GNAT superfamily N-acetyltransferase